MKTESGPPALGVTGWLAFFMNTKIEHAISLIGKELHGDEALNHGELQHIRIALICARELERENAKLRRALEINADFWARANSETDDSLIATMRELCSAALANDPREPMRSPQH